MPRPGGLLQPIPPKPYGPDLEALRERLRERLALAGEARDKEALRRLHLEAKRALLQGKEGEVLALWKRHKGLFADGKEIRPD